MPHKKSKIYSFYLRVETDDVNKPVVARCKTCGIKITWHASTLRRHLRKVHSHVHDSFLKLQEADEETLTGQSDRKPIAKRPRLLIEDEDVTEDEEEREAQELCDDASGADNIEKVFVDNLGGAVVKTENIQESDEEQLVESTSEVTKEDKFIEAVFPDYKKTTKRQLIEDNLELKRQIEHLKARAVIYEKTINRLLLSSNK